MLDVIEIADAASILIVEDRQSRIDWFAQRLPGAEFADTSRLAIEAISRRVPDVCFLDYDLHYFTSVNFANHLVHIKAASVVVVHSTNERGAETLSKILPDAIFSPFGEFEVRRRTR